MPKFKELFKKLFPDKEKEIEELLEEDELDMTPPAKQSDDRNDAVVNELKNLVKSVTAENKKLLDELVVIKRKEEENQKLVEDKAKNEFKEKVTGKINELLKETKITEADKAHWANLFEKDFESAEKVAALLKPVQEKTQNSSSASSSTQIKKPDNPIAKAILERNEIATD